MANWKQTLNVHHLWQGKLVDNDIVAWNNETAHELGKLLATYLTSRLKRQVEDDNELEEALSILASICTTQQWESLCKEDISWQDNPPLEEFDEAWRTFYDWADSNRIWVQTKAA
jgi:hypothetical protein